MLERFGLGIHMASAFAGTVALLGACVGLVVSQHVEAELRIFAVSELSDAADRLSARLDQQMAGDLALLHQAALDLSPEGGGTGVGALRPRLDALAADGFVWVGYLDSQGRLVAESGAVAVSDVLRQRLTSLAGGEPRAGVRALDAGFQGDGPPALLAVPAVGRGVLAAALSRRQLASLRDEVLSEKESRAGIALEIVNAGGRPVLTPGHAGGGLLEGWAQRPATGPAGQLGWRMVARQPLGRAMARAERMQADLLTLVGWLTLGGALIGGLISYRVSWPLRRLAAAAARIGAGDWRGEIPVSRYYREVSMLSTAMAGMIRTLRRDEARMAAVNEELERRVIARTTELRSTRDALAEQVARVQAVIDTAIDGVMILSADGRVETFNPACEMIFGWRSAEVVGRSSTLLMDRRAQTLHQEVFSGAAPATSAVGHPRRVMGRRRDGSPFPLEISLGLAEVGERSFYVAILRDATEQEAARQRLYAMATRDSLTGLGNRHFFMEGAVSELARARRNGSDLSVMLLDADHFKMVNDTFGHDGGDRVLRRLGEICRSCLRDVDLVGRLGGEEFAVLMPDTDAGMAYGAAERLRRLLADQTVMAEGQEIHFTVSIGVASLTGFDQSVEDLLRRADKALYRAKETGRNRVSLDENPDLCAAALIIEPEVAAERKKSQDGR